MTYIEFSMYQCYSKETILENLVVETAKLYFNNKGEWFNSGKINELSGGWETNVSNKYYIED